MELDVLMEKWKVKTGGFAPDPWVMEWTITHKPGDVETYAVTIPTKTGEVVEWTGETRNKRWVAVPEVEKKWILEAKARPMNPDSTEGNLKQAVKTGAEMVGQLSSTSLPLQWWLLSDVLEVGADLLNFDKFLQEPFAVGNVVLGEEPEPSQTIELVAPRRVESPKPDTREAWEKREFTNIETGKTYLPEKGPPEVSEGEKQGFVEVSIEPW